MIFFFSHSTILKMSVPIYQTLGKNPDFRDFITDIIIRMGLSSEDINKLFHPDSITTTMNEFAKCFVTRAADERYNYEMYELTGDSCLNKAVVMYFYTVLQSTLERKKDKEEKQGRIFHPDVRMVDYFNKLKALYISTKEYYDIADRLGFREFLQLGPRDVRDEIDKLLEDSLEAFIGCFEVMVDRCIQPYYAHQFVANFVKSIFTSRHINYHPDLLYDSITLLKETNDQTRQEIVSSDGSISGGYKYDYIHDKQSNLLHAYSITLRTGAKTRIVEIESIYGNSKQNQVSMARRILNYLKRNPERFPPKTIKCPPTPEELGIEEICF